MTEVTQAERDWTKALCQFLGFSLNVDPYPDEGEDVAVRAIIDHTRANPLPEVMQLLATAKALRDDLLMRAQFDDDCKVVCAGAGAWFRFNQAIDALDNSDGNRDD